MRIAMKSMAKALLAAAGLSMLVGAGGSLSAQTVYRIVGPDGRITFSDKPPAAPDAKAAVVNSGGRTATGGTAGASLPLELRQAMSRYPVTLYAGPNCGPCSSGRAMLNARGIPFNEKTVTSAADIAALQRIAGEPSLPLLTIGGQKLKGFSDVDWGQTLDAAGYPATSQLPASYRNPVATALVNVDLSAENTLQQAAAEPQQAPVAPPAPAAQAPNTSNPAGIRF
jgi:glutaredoxin